MVAISVLGAENGFSDVDLVAAREHVERIVRRSKTSFYWAMRVLPRRQRQAMFAIYAFCREVDDIADGPSSRNDKLAALDRWRGRIAQLYRGRASCAITQSLIDPVRRYTLRRRDFDALIEGMRTDAEGPVVAPSWTVLEQYCDRVAGAVGQLSVRVFGEPGPAGRDSADSLGRALQMTNILRDLSEDASLGRLYLPADELDRAGITERQPTRVLSHPKLDVVCQNVSQRALRAFADAERAMLKCDRSKMRPARMMRAIYERTLEGLNQRGWSDLDTRPSMRRSEKLLIALRHAFS
ncbi:MAG: presqualene diphosphate synthase HpnD [Geminicoccaceae bacterium]